MRFSGAGLSALFIGTALERGKTLLAGGGCRIFIRDHAIARGLLVQLDRVFDGDGGALRTLIKRGQNVFLSEERRGGKEYDSTCRYRLSPTHLNNIPDNRIRMN